MKKPFYVLFLALMWFAASAQSDSIIYYHYDFDVSRDSATWYRKLHFTNSDRNEYTATDYYINGKLKRSEGRYLRDKYRRFYPDGAFINYDENGNKESEGNYITDTTNTYAGIKTGKWIEYYKNGKPEWEYFYDGIIKDDYDDELVKSYWDSTGKKLLSDGNGAFTFQGKAAAGNDTMTAVTVKSIYKNGRIDGKHTVTFNNTGKPYAEEEYAGGKLITGTSYDNAGNKYTYSKERESAGFPGGDAALMRFLQKNIQYPQHERDYDIQGKVILRFAIDTTGAVKDIVVIRNVSKGLDKESVRVVSMMPRFTPSKRRGQLVDEYFNLPVVYRLQ